MGGKQDAALRLLERQWLDLGLALDVQRHNGDIRVGLFGREAQLQQVVVAFRVVRLGAAHNRAAVGQQPRAEDAVPQPRDEQPLARPLHHVQVEPAGLAGDAAPVEVIRERRGAGPVDGLAVDLEPLPDCLQALDARRRDDPFCRRADIQQVVHALRGAVDQQLDEVVDGLPVLVIVLVAPGVVDCAGGLPVALQRAGGVLIVAEAAVVADIVADAAADQALRLQRVDEVAQLGALLSGDDHRRIEPDQADGAVLCEQLPDLWLRLLLKVLRKPLRLHLLAPPAHAGILFPVSGAARSVPVLGLRVVEAQPDSRLGAGGSQCCHHVLPVGRGINNVVRMRRLEHGKAVVVLGGDHQVLHAGFLGNRHPLLGVELHRGELLSQLLVLGDWDLGVAHDPLAQAGDAFPLPFPRGNGVDAPVDEHPESCLAPPGEGVCVLLCHHVVKSSTQLPDSQYRCECCA